MIGVEDAFREFRHSCPAFSETSLLDRVRTSDFSRLDGNGHVYLDFTGAGLPPESLFRDHLTQLAAAVFGNPHAQSPTSRAAGRLVESARHHVLAFFNASPDEYAVIFTANATAALKLVGEAYPFGPGARFALTADNHNSVNGIREYARARNAGVSYVPISPSDLRGDADAAAATWALAEAGTHNLFAYPAQSNFSGVQHPLEWIAAAQERGWDVLLDAAAFVPCNSLDLRRWRPDYVDLSFYKMFGYPTGTGCLLARKAALQKLRRPWFGGGTVSFASVAGEGHRLTPGAAGFEDGTVNFLGLPAVERGLQYLASLGVETIHTRVTGLTAWLLPQLLALRHRNGRPVLRLYGPSDTDRRGGTIAVNLFDPGGNMWDCHRVEQLAGEQLISLRAGCHCNPGAREAALAEVLRASMGMVTNFTDVHRFVRFVASFIDRTRETPPAAVY